MVGVEEWYDGCTVFVTGGTGFMGKVLLEKLLRSLPGLKRIYVLIRPKRDVPPEKRLDAMLNLPVFDRLRQENKSSIKKLVAVEGDVLLPELGLKQEVRDALLSEVSIVFHCAASLRLEAELKPSVQHNTTGTHRVLQLCLAMENLKSVVHLSTAFCHCEQEVLYEHLYRASANPHDVMRLVEWLDEDSLRAITPKLLGPHPNCYTYSKRLAESLVKEQEGKLPVTVVRPTIVSPALKEPLPGWVDTLNGPVGLLVGAGKGVIRSMLCHPEYTAELVPVDIAINAMITIAWDTGVRRSELDEIPVYNVSAGQVIQLSWGDVVERGRKIVYENPFELAVWYPDGNIHTNRLIHKLCVIFLHIVPAYILDFLLLLARQKRFMVRLQRRISIGLEVLQYFTMRPWYFDTTEAQRVGTRMTSKELEKFYIANVEYNVNDYMRDCILGARQYVVKEPLSSIPRARITLKMLYLLDRLTKLVTIGFILYFALQHLETATYALDYIVSRLHTFPIIRAVTHT
ncbi:putative fatty acyl-CoA reductase CG5065 isoform X1 [Anabrus simplex]|uniref:putative fatty acyl-CoA reductase CG5065 isoform X1 n=1 Tax=Anabrus simplex TaxID=316456 RepID=UPI0035A38B2A